MTDEEDFPMVGVVLSDLTKEKMLEYLSRQQDEARYQWLKQQVTEVLCEGKATDCYSKYMLPRLTCEDSTGRRYTFDEIIDIQMKRSGMSEG